MLQMGIQPEKKRMRKDHTGETSLSRNWSISLFSRSTFILFLIHRDKWKIQSHAGSAVLTLIETRCFFTHTKVLDGFTSSSGLGGLLTFYGPFFLIMVIQPENLFSPRVIFLKSGATLRRHQIKLHSYRAKV